MPDHEDEPEALDEYLERFDALAAEARAAGLAVLVGICDASPLVRNGRRAFVHRGGWCAARGIAAYVCATMDSECTVDQNEA